VYKSDACCLEIITTAIRSVLANVGIVKAVFLLFYAFSNSIENIHIQSAITSVFMDART
jgi:hypothetical protein